MKRSTASQSTAATSAQISSPARSTSMIERRTRRRWPMRWAGAVITAAAHRAVPPAAGGLAVLPAPAASRAPRRVGRAPFAPDADAGRADAPGLPALQRVGADADDAGQLLARHPVIQQPFMGDCAGLGGDHGLIGHHPVLSPWLWGKREHRRRTGGAARTGAGSAGCAPVPCFMGVCGHSVGQGGTSSAPACRPAGDGSAVRARKRLINPCVRTCQRHRPERHAFHKSQQFRKYTMVSAKPRDLHAARSR